MSKSRLMSTTGAAARLRRTVRLNWRIQIGKVTVVPEYFIGIAMTVRMRMRTNVMFGVVVGSPQRTVGMHDSLGTDFKCASTDAF